MTIAPGAPILASDVQDLVDAINARRYVEKTALTNRNNTATLADDPHLFASLEANSTYIFELVLFVSAATSNTPDIDLALTWPAGCTASWAPMGPATNVTAATLTSVGLNAWVETTTSGASIQRGVTNSGSTVIWIKGRIVTGANTGNLRLQWAQDVATAENTTIQKGSHMTIEKVA